MSFPLGAYPGLLLLEALRALWNPFGFAQDKLFCFNPRGHGPPYLLSISIYPGACASGFYAGGTGGTPIPPPLQEESCVELLLEIGVTVGMIRPCVNFRIRSFVVTASSCWVGLRSPLRTLCLPTPLSISAINTTSTRTRSRKINISTGRGTGWGPVSTSSSPPVRFMLRSGMIMPRMFALSERSWG